MVLKKVEKILSKIDGIDSFQTIGGYGAVTNTYQPNYGSIFARLKPWEEERRGTESEGNHGAAAAGIRGHPGSDHLPF